MEKRSQIKNLKILIVGHVTESYGPMQSLPEYCRKRVEEFAVISHPFSYCTIPYSECLLYQAGEVKEKYRGLKIKTSSPIHYLADVGFTVWFVIRMRKKWDLFIGSDCLNAFTGIILRAIGVVSKVIFYEHDYSPERFANWTLDAIFHYINGFSARHADIVWDNPPNLLEMRKKQRADLKKVIRVPHGVDLSKIKILPLSKIQRKTLVYIGYIDQNKGLQLVVKAVKKLTRKIPDIKVSVVGSGHYEPKIRHMVKKLKLEKYFHFFGFTSHDWTLGYVPSCALGLAPYLNRSKSTFRFAEPLKVKDYLGCGLPVIITKVPDIAKEIEKKKLGMVIRYNTDELAGAIFKLLTDDKFYRECRRNVLAYSKNISWNYTFDQAFAKTLAITGIN
ncbi:MAG: glycosyltransferase [Microgenomates group bacterium]